MKAIWMVAILAAASGPDGEGDVPDNTEVFREDVTGSDTPPGGPTPSLSGPEREVVGTVLEVEATRVWIEREGVAVPITVVGATEISGVESVDELEPGEEVRARYTLQPDGNLATEIRRLPGPRRARDPIDVNPRTQELVPDVGETRGPGSPLPPEPER